MSPYLTITEAAESYGVDLRQLVDELDEAFESVPN
jgi:hypothetical protein